MSSMDDLVRFLRTQLDDDERVAHAAADGDPVWNIRHPEPGAPSWSRSALLGKSLVSSCDPATLTPAEGEHIARWDPARVLAEVEAVRKLLDWLDDLDRWESGANVFRMPDTDDARKALAQPYADRPGYREEWRV